jgi:hypothetical protein
LKSGIGIAGRAAVFSGVDETGGTSGGSGAVAGVKLTGGVNTGGVADGGVKTGGSGGTDAGAGSEAGADEGERGSSRVIGSSSRLGCNPAGVSGAAGTGRRAVCERGNGRRPEESRIGGGGSAAVSPGRIGGGGSGPVGGRVEGIAVPPERVSGEVGGRAAGGGSGPERGGAGSGPVEARLGMIGSVPDPRRGGTGAVEPRLAAPAGMEGAAPPTEPGDLGGAFFLTRRENFS